MTENPAATHALRLDANVHGRAGDPRFRSRFARSRQERPYRRAAFLPFRRVIERRRRAVRAQRESFLYTLSLVRGSAGEVTFS